MKTTMFRQGDVLILILGNSEPAAPGEEVPRENGAVVLAHGKVTGHSHALYGRGAKLFRLHDSTDRFLKVSAKGGMPVKHEEHGAITLPAGDYRVRIQCEWSDEEANRVQD